MALALSGLMSGVQAQPWQPGAWRTDWWRNGATLDMDFANNRYMVSLTAPVTYTSLTQFITAVSGTFTRAGANETATGDPFYLAANQSFVSRATSTTQLTATGSPFYADASQAFYSRATSATYIDSSGVMQTAASNVARADYDPLTLAYKGVLIEPARTNYISNSTMQWSGSVPSGWSMAGQGVTPTVVASGTISGMNYIDVQFLGVGDTVSRAYMQRYTNVQFGGYVATAGNADWATSAYIGYVSGSYPSGTYKNARILTANLNSSNSYINELSSAGSLLNYTGALKRFGITGKTTSATAFVWPYFQITYDQGESVNLTLRFAAPQIEMGTSSTSFIPTTSAPATRAADVYTQETASYFNSAGVLKFATAGAQRADYHPSTLAYRGILAEPARTNLVKYSNQPGSGNWYYQPSYTTITADSAVAPDGTLTADRVSTTAYMVVPGLGVVSNTAYTFSVWLKSPTGSSQAYTLNVEDTVPGDANLLLASSTVVANGSWQRFSINTTAPSQTSNFRVSVRAGDYYMWGAQVEAGSTASSYIPTGASTASRAADVYTSGYSGTYFDASGTLRNAPANTPRLDYDPSTSEPKGVLIEEARTNLIKYPTLQSAYWTKGPAVTAAYDTLTDPAGGTNASMISPAGTCGYNCWINSGVSSNYTSITSGTTYIYSIFVKPLTANAGFQLRGGKADSSDGAYATFTLAGVGSVSSTAVLPSGTYVSSGIQYVGSGWYRPWIATQTAQSTTNGALTMVVYDGASYAVWGAQIEQGAFPTSYIPTSGSSVTRPADAFTIPTSTGWYTQGQGTLLGNGQVPMAGNMYSGIVALDNGGTNNSIQELLSLNGSSHIAIEVWNGGAFNGTGGGSLAYTTPGDLMKAGAAFDAVDFRGVFNGSLLDNNTRAVPTMSVLRVGNGRGGLFNLNGWARRIVYLPTREPDYSLPDYTR